MNDTQLYEQILGLTPPWRVAGVTLKKELRQIEIEVICDETVWACPECRQRMHAHGSERRWWRHLDTCQFQTLVVADVPRVKCATHGTQQVRVPWAEKYSRFTALFERFAIDVLLECSIRGGLRTAGDQLGRGRRDQATRGGPGLGAQDVGRSPAGMCG